ncbi:MAG: alpha/beta hydrolase [Candidatus Daviesbacteria bacterium]|nr:alpha/beta hydrolase [Candidatus Daviesbacteria bacterium]
MLTITKHRTVFKVADETLVGDIVAFDQRYKPRSLFLHGAGQATRQRALPLAMKLAELGNPSFLFDFSGHGESTGSLLGSSLKRRIDEAEAAMAFLSKKGPHSLLASSMSGHIAMQLLRDHDFANLVLFAPAIYDAAAIDIPFGPRFSKAIRQRDSWKRSNATAALREYTGNLLIFWGENDAVVPRGVIDFIFAAAEHTKVKKVITVPGADHQLAQWTNRDEDALNMVTREVVSMLNS